VSLEDLNIEEEPPHELDVAKIKKAIEDTTVLVDGSLKKTEVQQVIEPFDASAITMAGFRQTVEAIADKRHREICMVGYLLAARDCEIITKVSSCEIIHRKTKPYGQEMRVLPIQTFKVPGTKDTIVKVLPIKVSVAKRHKSRQDKPDRPRTMYTKTIALPIDPKYEPWILPLLKRMMKHKDRASPFSFDVRRRTICKVTRQYLDKFLPPKSKYTVRNVLRHIRLTHLRRYYHFDNFDLCNYAGWTFKGGVGKSAGQADSYIQGNWTEYFPKLLIPYADVIA
jgi:hypothetical protein